MRLSIRTKIAILFATSLSLIALVILLVFSLEVRQRNKALYIQQANIAAEELVYKTERLLQLGLYPVEFFGYEALCEKLVNDTESVIYSALVDEQGNVIFQGGLQHITSSAPTYANISATVSDSDFLIRKPLQSTIQQKHYIVVIIDQQLLENKLINFIKKMLIYALSIIAIGVLTVLYFLRVNLGKPLHSLLEHIQDMELGSRPDQEWDLLKRNDELSTVAHAFEQMVQRLSRSQLSLAQSNLELRELTNELEFRVELRTKALKEANKKLHSQAHLDILTGLSNRREFEILLTNRFKHAQRHHHHFSVIMADLNGFKKINDQYGHITGDHALKITAKRLSTTLRAGDNVFRFGGDEFAFIIEQYPDLAALLTILTKIKNVVEQPFDYQQQAISLGISIGVACASPQHDCDANQLLIQAEQAMYQAKKQGLDYVIHDNQDEPVSELSSIR